MVSGISELGIEPYIYDASYWQAMLEKFKTQVNLSRHYSAELSEIVRQKNKLHNEIRSIINLVIILLSANYPTDYKLVLRSWEVQMERF